MIYADDPRYGLRRDSPNDQTAALQRILDEARDTWQAVMLPYGRYQCAGLRAYSGLRLIGEGRTATRLLLHPSAGPDAVLLWSDGREVTVEGVGFDGQMKERGGTGLVQFFDVVGLRFTDCAVINTPYIGFALTGRDNTISRCYFTRTGRLEVTPEGGAAIWMGYIEGVSQPLINNRVEQCLFEDLEWSAIYSCPQMSPRSDTTVTGNTSRRTKESAFFLYGFDRLTVTDNTIEDVTCKNISACGIESGGMITARGNKIRRTQAEAISLQQAIDAIVIDNECVDGNGIVHTSIAFDPVTAKLIGPPRNSRICGNVFDGRSRIQCLGQSGAQKAESFCIADNVGLDPTDEHGGVYVDPEFRGERIFVDRNLVGHQQEVV